jgi:hypothetical protein
MNERFTTGAICFIRLLAYVCNYKSYFKMKKFLFFTLLTCFSAAGAFAQSKTSSSTNQATFSVGIEGAVPVGNYSDLYTFGFGASVKAAIPVASSIDFTLSAGYTDFLIKSDVKAILQAAGSNQSAAGFVPLKAGLRFKSQEGFYFEGQLGAAIATTGGGGTAFAYSPGVGYIFNSGVEIGVRYEGWSKSGETFSMMGIRLAYNFQ